MFVLLNIETLQPDILNLPANTTHKLTFKVVFTIKDVPDTFTGIVFENASGDLQLDHFNNPRGNRRKVITLKNKLAPGSFEQIKQAIFATSRGESVAYPQQLDILQRRASGTPRA
ncbi:MAG: hypothetical protein OEY43_09455 [Gammaproteobacteria bacterium]|nr:hypothetical protein [Gammaproteobacteria bacterium]